MIDKKPKTYNEIVRMKKCYTLTNYYSNIKSFLNWNDFFILKNL